MKLKIESIPISTWGISLANRLPKNKWDDIRQKVYRGSDYRCSICNSNNMALHAHEVWKFDDRRYIQRLERIICVCELCHDTIHFGRTSEVKDSVYVDKCIEHWCRINRKERKDFFAYLEKVKETNRLRANRQYIVKVGRWILC